MKTAEEIIFDKAKRYADEKHIKPEKGDYNTIRDFEQDYSDWEFVHKEALESYQDGCKDTMAYYNHSQFPQEVTDEMIEEMANVAYVAMYGAIGFEAEERLFKRDYIAGAKSMRSKLNK